MFVDHCPKSFLSWPSDFMHENICKLCTLSASFVENSKLCKTEEKSQVIMQIAAKLGQTMWNQECAWFITRKMAKIMHFLTQIRSTYAICINPDEYVKPTLW